MSFLNKYNKSEKKFNAVIGDNVNYLSLNDLVVSHKNTDVFKIDGLYINTKSKFGERPIVLTGNYLVNLPQHLTDTVKQMINDSDLVQMVNNGQVGFSFYAYQGKDGRIYNSINWVEIKQDTNITTL